jgi:hypothetical protein
MDAMKSGSAILTRILFQEELPGSPFIEGRRVKNNGLVAWRNSMLKKFQTTGEQQLAIGNRIR